MLFRSTGGNRLTNVDQSGYVARYTFRVIGNPGSSVSIVPVAQIASGTQMKHSDTTASGATATLSFSTVAINYSLAKRTTSNSNLETTTVAGTTYLKVPYELKLTSTSTTATFVDEIVDTPQSGTSFLSGSAKLTDVTNSNVVISDPTYILAEANLNPRPNHFVGPFQIDSTHPVILTYTMLLPAVKTTYTNQAYAQVGDLRIGATASTIPQVTVTTSDTSTTITVDTTTVTTAVQANTDPATNIDTKTATMNATIDPNGNGGTAIFQYSTSPSLATFTEVTATTPSSGTLTGSLPLAASYTFPGNLTPNTTYYYRIRVGSIYGDILSWTTAGVPSTPSATTLAASSVGTTTATLNGTINPNFTPIVRISFLYRASNSDLTTGTTEVIVYESDGVTFSTASGGTSQSFLKSLTGLTNGTTYYFKIRACTVLGSGNPATCSGSNYVDGGTQSFTMGRANQTITFNAPADKTYGDPTFTISSTTDATGLTTTNTSLTPGVCTISGSTITIVGVGTCTIRASQSGNSSYNPATDVDQSFYIAPKTLSVSAVDKSKIWGDSTPTMSETITGFAYSDSATISSVNREFSGKSVSYAASSTAPTALGTYAISLSAASLTFSTGSGVNYVISYVDATYTINQRPITVTADSQSKQYGAADPALTYTRTSGTLAAGDSNASVLSGALTRAAGTNVGSYAITQGTLTASSNYVLTYVADTLTVTARPITVTAENKSKKQVDPDPTFTYVVTSGSLVGADAFTGSLTRASLGTNTPGDYAITQGTLALSSNYTLTYVAGTLTITDKTVPYIAWGPLAHITYGDTLTATQLSAHPQVSSSDPTPISMTCTYTPALGALLNAETNTLSVTCTPADPTTYSNASKTVTLVVDPRPIGVIAQAKSKYYGDSDPDLTYTVTGSLVGSDAFTGALSRAAGSAPNTYLISQNSLALSSNYTITYTSANFTINKRPITITADAKSKYYGDGDPALTYTLTSGTYASGEDTSTVLSGALGRLSGENYGTYTINVGTVQANSNYLLSFVSAIFTINKRAITVTADAKSKYYGDSDPSLTYQITSGSLASTDTSASVFSGALSRTSGSNVGTYTINKNTLDVTSNYALTYTSADLTINARPITITADNKTRKTTDADPTLTYTINSGSLVSPDAFSGSMTSTGTGSTSAGTYPITKGTLALSSNYTLTFNNGTLTVTNKAIPYIAWGPLAHITYGETLTSTQNSAHPQISSSDPTPVTMTCTYSPVNGTKLDAGTHTLSVTCTPSDTSTYSDASTTVTLIVDSRTVTVTADNKSVVQGASLTSIGYTVGAVVAGDPADPFTGITCTSDYSTSDSAGTSRYTRCSGGTATNYIATYIDGSVTISSATYTVTYTSGGGSGTAPTETNKAAGDVFNLKSGSSFTNSGYTFAGWSCNSGTTRSAGYAYTMPSSSLTCVAQWTAVTTYSITYTNGGGTGTVPTESPKASGDVFNLGSGSGLSRSGYTFAGWSCNSSSTQSAGSSFTMPAAALTCVAQWTLNSSGGGSSGGSSNSANTTAPGQVKKVAIATLVTISTTPVKEKITVVNTPTAPSAAPTVAPTPAATPSPAASSTPRPTTAPTPTPTPAASSTARPTTAPTPSASPSATSNGNGNSGSNGNSGNNGNAGTNGNSGNNGNSINPGYSNANNLQLSQTTVIPTSGTKEITFSGNGISKVALVGGEVSVEAKPTFSGKTTVNITVKSENEEVSIITADVIVLPQTPVSGKVVVTDNSSKISWAKSPNATGYTVLQGDTVLCTSRITMCNLKAPIEKTPAVQVIATGRDKTESLPMTTTYEVVTRTTVTPDIALIVYFDTNKYNLDDVDKAEIRAFAAEVKKYKYTEVDITGHTDSQGGVDNNVLSLNRAKSAANYLIQLVPNLKVTVGGYAATVNAAANDSAAGMAANRRVEFRVVEWLVTMTKQVPYTPTKTP